MKYIISILILVALLVFLFNTNEDPQLNKSEAVDSKLDAIELSDGVSDQSLEPDYSEQDTIEVKSQDDKTINLVDSSNNVYKQEFVDIANKELNAKALEKVIDSDNFKSFLFELSSKQTALEAERTTEVFDIINDETELSAYEVNYACGQGICAVEVNYVPNEKATELADKLSRALNFGAMTYHLKKNNDLTNSLRFITAADSSVRSISIGSLQ